MFGFRDRAHRPIYFSGCTAVFVGLGALFWGCKPSVEGFPCTKDEECGSGYDCFKERCVRICTKPEECSKDQTCHRYHCIDKSSSPASPNASRVEKKVEAKGPSLRKESSPSESDRAMLSELRAIRLELQKLRESMEKQRQQKPKVPLLSPPRVQLPEEAKSGLGQSKVSPGKSPSLNVTQ